MSKFNKTIEFFLENYISKGTYSYIPQASKTEEKKVIDPELDLGAKQNRKTVDDFVNAAKYDTSLGRHPSNLQIKRYADILRRSDASILKKFLSAVNTECCSAKDAKKIEFDSKDQSKTVDCILNCVGVNPAKWEDLAKKASMKDFFKEN